MNTTVNIRFGKKDSQLIEWWDEMAERDLNISRTIYLAILYYIYTGDYLTIAKMKKSSTADTAVLKKFYLQENTEVFDWLSDKQDQKLVISQIIRGILKQSIEITQGENNFVEMDKLVLLVEQAKSGRINSRPIVNEVETPAKTMDYKKYHGADTKKESSATQEQAERKREVSRPPVYEEDEAPEGPDIFDILAGGHKLEL